MTTPAQYRQGDILIEKIDKLPSWHEYKPREDGVILKGESTGHAHRLDFTRGKAQVLEADNGTVFLHAMTVTPLVHEEHDTIQIPEGFYQVVRQREYDSDEISRFVHD